MEGSSRNLAGWRRYPISCATCMMCSTVWKLPRSGSVNARETVDGERPIALATSCSVTRFLELEAISESPRSACALCNKARPWNSVNLARLAIFGNFVATPTVSWYCQRSLANHGNSYLTRRTPGGFMSKTPFGPFFRHTQYVGAAAGAGLLVTGCASGAGNDADGDFPSQDIRLVVPWEAGGSGDLSARTLAPHLEDELGVNVIVENRPG